MKNLSLSKKLKKSVKLKNSLVKGSDNLSDTDGLKLAGHIYRMIKTSKFSDGFSVDRILKTTDPSDDNVSQK